MAVRGTVLVVDDSEDTLDMIERMLLETDYAVGRATTGKEALLSAAQNQPDLVLIDIKLPDIDGWKVCQGLKSHPTTRHTPVIFMTGLHLEKEDIIRGFELGAVDYITKPFHGPILVQRVNAAIRSFAMEKEQRNLAVMRGEALTALSNAALVGLEARALTAMATISSSLATNVTPPVAVAIAKLEAAREGLDEEHRALVESALHRIRDIRDYVDRIRRLSEEIESDAIRPLQEVVQTIATPMAERMRERGLEVELKIEETPSVRGAVRIAPVVTDLLENAAAALDEGGRIELRTYCDGEWAVLVIADNGRGMDLSGEWDPFAPPLEARKDGRSIGLGLPMCQSIVTGFGGSIEVDSTPGEGTTVEVRLPMAGPAAEE